MYSRTPIPAEIDYYSPFRVHLRLKKSLLGIQLSTATAHPKPPCPTLKP